MINNSLEDIKIPNQSKYDELERQLTEKHRKELQILKRKEEEMIERHRWEREQIRLARKQYGRKEFKLTTRVKSAPNFQTFSRTNIPALNSPRGISTNGCCLSPRSVLLWRNLDELLKSSK